MTLAIIWWNNNPWKIQQWAIDCFLLRLFLFCFLTFRDNHAWSNTCVAPSLTPHHGNVDWEAHLSIARDSPTTGATQPLDRFLRSASEQPRDPRSPLPRRQAVAEPSPRTGHMTDLARGSPSDQSADWAPRCHGVATYQNNSFTAITLENHRRSVALWLEGGIVIERRCVRFLRTS